MTKAVSTACKNKGYNPHSLCRESGQCKTITFGKPQTTTNADDRVHTSLFVKDKFSVSHELSAISNLSTLSEIRRVTQSLNESFEISNCPNNIIGVQTNFRARVLHCLQCFVQRTLKKV